MPAHLAGEESAHGHDALFLAAEIVERLARQFRSISFAFMAGIDFRMGNYHHMRKKVILNKAYFMVPYDQVEAFWRNFLLDCNIQDDSCCTGME